MTDLYLLCSFLLAFCLPMWLPLTPSVMDGLVVCLLRNSCSVFKCFDAMRFCVKCRLDTKYPICKMFKLFKCAVCQVEIKPDEGFSIHVGSSDYGKLHPWDGPFLCSSCQEKKEAMEGKRPPGGTNNRSLCPPTPLHSSLAQLLC